MVFEKVAEKIFVREGVKIPKSFADSEKKGYVYLCFIYDYATHKSWLKVGTSCNVMQRMKQHLSTHKSDIQILWISPALSKYTTLKVEDEFKDFTRNHLEWEYIRQDRFFMPDNVSEVEIKIRKTYVVPVT